METVRIGPENWLASLHILLAGYCDGNAQGKRLANQELKNMARLADLVKPLLEALQLAHGRLEEDTPKWIIETINNALKQVPWEPK